MKLTPRSTVWLNHCTLLAGVLASFPMVFGVSPILGFGPLIVPSASCPTSETGPTGAGRVGADGVPGNRDASSSRTKTMSPALDAHLRRSFNVQA